VLACVNLQAALYLTSPPLRCSAGLPFRMALAIMHSAFFYVT